MGGTKVHVALVRDEKVISDERFPTSDYGNKADLIQALIDAIQSQFNHRVKGIGIGVPGLVDEREGIVYDIQNIRGWDSVPLKKLITQKFPVEVRIANDANLFALGERNFGKGKSLQNVLGIALGTGIGAGLVLNGKLYSGNFSGAGEIGSIPYLDKTIEDYCSGKFFKDLHHHSGEHFAHLATENDSQALQLFEDFGKHLGKMIKLILFVLAPDAIIFGGSISKSFDLFEPAMRRELESFPFKKVMQKLVIAPSELNNAAILGAAFLAQTNFEREQMKNTNDKNTLRK
jgi:glucokinase